MLDLLLFAYVIRCLLEFRIDERETWLLRANFALGAAITNNWAMLGFFPTFVVALVWIKGLSFFNLRFLARMSICGVAGLLLYLLLPLLQGVADTSSVPFWPALKANLIGQRSILTLLYRYGRQEVALLALTSLLPVFVGPHTLATPADWESHWPPSCSMWCTAFSSSPASGWPSTRRSALGIRASALLS
jgi:hypothetical protein